MKYILIILSAAIMACVDALPAYAVVITVDTADDVVAEDGQCSLREAIVNANTASQSGSADCDAGEADGNAIVFDRALAGETITLSGEHLQITSRGLTIEGPVPGDASGLILDGDLASRVFSVYGPGQHVEVVLRDLTLTRGHTTAMNQPGGGVIAENVSLILDKVIVTGNSTQASSSGGGGVFGRIARIELIDSMIEKNYTEGLNSPGGGIQVRSSALNMVRTAVRDNRTEGSSASGGGVWAGFWAEAPASDASLVDCEVSGNQTFGTSARGGGIYHEGGTLNLNRVTVAENQSGHVGGGIRLSKAVLRALNSTISGNTANQGGGGGMYVSGATAVLTHVTVAFNSASGTSGIFVFGNEIDRAKLQLNNTLVVNNTCAASGAFSAIDSVGSLSTHAACTGEAIAPEDIALLSLADNGGSSRTHGLGPQSVAIDAVGDCEDDFGVTVDQRGERRPGRNSSACDGGAFEEQEPPPEADLAAAFSVDPDEAEAGESVTFTLVVNNQGSDAAANTVAQVILPDGYEFVAATPATGSYDNGTGVWTIGVLDVLDSTTLELNATLNAVGDYLATAIVSADTFDPESGNNTAQAEVMLVIPVPTGPMIVDTLQDVAAEDGLCSLREAIINGNNGDQSGSTDCAFGDLILFDAALIGGTIELTGTALPTIVADITIEGPAVGDPAGIVLDGNESSRILEVDGAVRVRMQDLTLAGGRTMSSNSPGGAFHVSGGADVKLERLRLTGNGTNDNISGGGAVAAIDSTVYLIDCEISDNWSHGIGSSGGGLFASYSMIFLEGTTVADNQSSGYGGGLFLRFSEMEAVNSTISGNSTAQSEGGGGAYINRGTAELKHSTVALNYSRTVPSGLFVNGEEGNPAELLLNNSLVVNNVCTVFGDHATISSNGSLSTSSICNTGSTTPADEIKLLPLSGNGGLTRTHALGAGSAAIGFAGDCANDFGIETDQRGEPRPGGSSGVCDAGAYEFQGQNENFIFTDRFEGGSP